MSDNEDQIDAFIEDFSNLFPENSGENTGDMKILEDFFQDKIPKEIKNSEMKNDYKVLLENFNDLLKEVKKETNNLRKKDIEKEKLTEQISKLKVKYFGKKVEILTKLNKLVDEILSAKEDISKDDEKKSQKVEKEDEIKEEQLDIGEIKEEDIDIPEVEEEPTEAKSHEKETLKENDKPSEVESLEMEISEEEGEPSKTKSSEIEVPEIEGEPAEVESPPMEIPEIEGEPAEVESPPMEIPEIEGEPIEVESPPMEVPEIGGEPIEVESPPMEVPEIESEPIEVESPPIEVPGIESEPIEVESPPNEPIIKDKEIEVKEKEISKQKEELKPELEEEYQPKPFLSEVPPQEIINSAIQANKSVPEKVKSKYMVQEEVEEKIEDFDSLYAKAISMIKNNKYEEAKKILKNCLSELILPSEDRRRKTVMEKIKDVNKQLGKIKYDEGTKLYKNNDFKSAVRLWEESIKYFNEANLQNKATSVQKTMDKIKKRYNIVIEEKPTLVVESSKQEGEDEDNNAQFCPECNNKLEYIAQYDRYYCRNCRKYV